MRYEAMILAIFICYLAGCVPIPVEPEMQGKIREFDRDVIREKTLTSGQVNCDFDNDKNEIEVTLMGRFTVEQWEEVVYEGDMNERYLIVGFFPGMGAALFSKDMPGALRNLDIAALSFATDSSLLLILGLPSGGSFFPLITVFGGGTYYVGSTIGSWFAEPDSPWARPSEREGWRYRMSLASLIGFSKTGRIESFTKTEKENHRTLSEEMSLSDTKVILEIEDFSYSTERQTSEDGIISFDLEQIPVQSPEPVVVRLQVPVYSEKVDSVALEVPGDAFGGE